MRRLILAVATQGKGHGDEARLLTLLSELNTDQFNFDRGSKVRSGWKLLRAICHQRPGMVVMEGTGVGGGLAVMLGRMLAGVPYIVSSGDAVAPYLSARMPVLMPLFSVYERLLCRYCAGFIGWTPYLVGRALTFGAPRAVTAPGWDEPTVTQSESVSSREETRAALGIRPEEIVFGIAGSLDWNKRVGYCYGYELVRAALTCRRDGVRVLIVGDGTGRRHLERLAGNSLGKTIHLTGRVPRNEVPRYLSAMDVGSLPQSVDGVGSFRYTTKLSEYFAASLPVVTGQIPLAYDLDSGWLWRLPGRTPWDPHYIRSIASLMQRVNRNEIRAKRNAVPSSSPIFDRNSQIKRVTAFLSELLECAR